MTEDPTKKLNGEKELTEDLLAQMSDSQKLDWLVRAVSQMDECLTRLEVRFEGRDTNPPLPPNFAERFITLEKELRLTNHKLDKLGRDVLETHAQQQELTVRMDAFEQRSN